MHEPLHHGKLLHIFEPKYVGTDYFYFFCRKCKNMVLTESVSFDHEGRLIFNLYCPNCQICDAIKVGLPKGALIFKWKKDKFGCWIPCKKPLAKIRKGSVFQNNLKKEVQQK